MFVTFRQSESDKMKFDALVDYNEFPMLQIHGGCFCLTGRHDLPEIACCEKDVWRKFEPDFKENGYRISEDKERHFNTGLNWIPMAGYRDSFASKVFLVEDREYLFTGICLNDFGFKVSKNEFIKAAIAESRNEFVEENESTERSVDILNDSVFLTKRSSPMTIMIGIDCKIIKIACYIHDDIQTGDSRFGWLDSMMLFRMLRESLMKKEYVVNGYYKNRDRNLQKDYAQAILDSIFDWCLDEFYSNFGGIREGFMNAISGYRRDTDLNVFQIQEYYKKKCNRTVEIYAKEHGIELKKEKKL